MVQNEEKKPKLFPDLDDTSRKTVFTIVYWSVAVGVLIGLLSLVFFLTSPIITPSVTPDISATIEQALADALGPTTETPTPSQTLLPSETPTPSRTPLPSFTPTISLTPTITPIPTNTPGFPTFTPVLPGNVNEAFRVVELSPAQYDYGIALLEGVPDLLPDGSENEGYFDAFYHASVMQSDALRQYPADLRAPSWRWGLAYNLARIGDERANILYASYLNQEINKGELSLEDLPGYVEGQDKRIRLSYERVTPVLDNFSNYLLDLNTGGGSMFLWFTETAGATTIYPLSDETNFRNPSITRVSWDDMNGDGVDDLILFTPVPQGRYFTFPKAFDLTKTPPKELAFKPDQIFEVGLENEYEWNTIDNEKGFYDFLIQSVVYPPCPVTISHSYQWDGRWFVRTLEDYNLQPVSQLLEYCELLVDQANSVWGLQAAIQIMEALLPSWPPASTTSKTYPLDAQDEWKYRLGVYHALAGNIQASKNYFEGIIQSPATPTSRWVKPAQEFLKDFETPEGLYKVCVKSKVCDPRIALMKWVSSIAPENAANTEYYLKWNGVSIRYTNQFDFEGDERPERWFTIRHRETEKLELWILSISDAGAQLLFVDTVDTNAPYLTRYTNLKGQTYVWIGSQQSFSLVRHPDSTEASITLLPPSYYYAELTNQLAKNSIDALLSGFSPVTIRERLEDHLAATTFVCLSKEECARFYYALGLAAELSGDEELAADSYLKIWWDSFESPFTTIARMKLAYKPGYGPLPTPTITNTPSNTPRPTFTVTPFYSLTPTPTTSTTATMTSTPTVTFTEDPNMTYTPTPSHTPTSTITSTPTASNTTEPYP